jgi:hypothetical protein
LPDDHPKRYVTHFATCAAGAAYDRAQLGGYDHTNTVNLFDLVEV